MLHESPSPETIFGYLSTIQSLEHGYFGGYLIVSVLGRPLEFHCTAPVRPSRALEILYGPTLEPYLLGEQISGTLLGAAKLTPRLILTDQSPALYVRSKIGVPMVLVLGRAEDQNPSITRNNVPAASEFASTIDSYIEDKPSNSGDHDFTAGSYKLQLPCGYEGEEPLIAELLTIFAQHVDLAEPFDRIHEAIREAQRIGGRGNEGHGQAA